MEWVEDMDNQERMEGWVGWSTESERGRESCLSGCCFEHLLLLPRLVLSSRERWAASLFKSGIYTDTCFYVKWGQVVGGSQILNSRREASL